MTGDTVEEAFRSVQERLDHEYERIVEELKAKVERAKQETLRKLTG